MIKILILLILSFSYFPVFGATPEETLKHQIKSFFEVFKSNGITSFGHSQQVKIDSLISVVDTTTFLFLNNASFDKQSKKSRRSAFYTDQNGGVIYINKDRQPSAELLVHEIIRDKHYEISTGMAALYSILQNSKTDFALKLILTQIIKTAIDDKVDRFGLSAESPHKWIAKNVGDLALANNILETEGGDVSGGGGDDLSIRVKSRVLAELTQRLVKAYQNELGWTLERVQKHVSNLFFLLSIKVYFETNYDIVIDSNEPEFNFGTDSIERIAFFPYLIRIPEKANIDKVVPSIVDVILQSDLFKDVPSLQQKQHSNCECRGSDMVRALGRVCPDVKKFHKSVHWLIQWYQQDYENNEMCKMVIYE